MAHKNGTEPSIAEAIQFGRRPEELPLEAWKWRTYMRTKRGLYLGVAAVAIALAFGVAPTPSSAQNAAAVSIGTTDIVLGEVDR